MEYNDITQVPFVSGQGAVQQPLLPPQQPQPILADVPTDALRAQITGTPGADNLPVEPLAAYQEVMRAKERADAIQQAKLDLEKTDAQQNSFMPKFIATVAALKGDFRPLMQMEEQKRATAIGKALFPTQLKINEYKDKGDYESAENLANTAYQAAGARSKELVPYFQQLLSDISKKRTEVQNMKAAWEMLDQQVGDDKTNPNYKAVKALGTLVKNHTPVAESIFNQVMVSMRPQVTQREGQTEVFSPWSQQQSVIPTAATVSPSAVDTVTGNQLVAKYGLVSPANLRNILSGLPATDATGKVIAPNSPDATMIKQEYSATRQDQADIEMAKQIPLDPLLADSYMQAAARYGVSRQDAARQIATRMLDPVIVRASRQDEQDRKKMLAEAPALASANADAKAFYSAGGMFLMNDSKSLDHLKPVYLATLDEARQSGGKLIATDRSLYEKRILPAMDTIQSLDYVYRLIDEIGDINTPGARISAGTKQLISKVFNINIDDTTLFKTVVKSIFDNAIEEVSGKGKLPNAATGQLKEMTSGAWADTNDMKKAAALLQERMKEHLANTLPAGTAAPATRVPSTAGSRESGGGKITKGDVKGALRQEAERHMKWLRDNGYLQEVPEGATGTPATSATPAPSNQPATGVKKGTLR